MYTPKETIGSLTKAELLKLLTECFSMLGRQVSNQTPEEIETLIKEAYHWQGRMWVDTFREAFSAYAASEIEIDRFTTTISAQAVSKIQKAYREKKWGKKEVEKNTENIFITSTDEGYYNSLVCVMEGRKSDKFQERKPKCESAKGNEIPFTWAWDAVYNHLRKLNKCDEAESFKGQKMSVITWLRITYPDCTFQKDLFPISYRGNAKNIKEFLHYS